MVETSSPKPSSKVADNKSNSPPYKVKLVKGSKPLIHHKFYLDIEKHNVASKIENKIKELGGSIEFILSKNITHFITDKQQSVGTGSGELAATTGSKSKNYQSATNCGVQSATTTTTLVNNNNSFSPNITVNPHTPRSIVDIPSAPSPVLTYETKAGNTSTKKKSRTDAILLRVGQGQQQQQKSTPNKVTNGLDTETIVSEQTQSPTQVVKSWGRPVWTTEHALRFFDKVYTALKLYLPTASQEQENSRRAVGGSLGGSNQRKLSSKVKTLRGDFIKIETLDKRYRPFYQEFKQWPRINLTARLTHSPFDSEGERGVESQRSKFKKFSKIDSRTTSKFKTVGTIMTRKSRPTQQHQGGTIEGDNNTAVSRLNNSRSGSDNKQCGYCEICHVEYDTLRIHLKSEEHLKFARNDDNFVSLDKLIDSGANVQNFLKLNEATSNNKREPLLNGTMKKHSKKVATTHLTNGEDSVDDCDKNGINGSSEEVSDEDALNPPRAKRKCLNPKTNKKESHTKSKPDEDNNMESKILATRIRGLRWNAPSPESRPPIKEPPVYKIAKDSVKETNKNNKIIDLDKQVVVKLKRVRQSELNLLNNEAEQFMFPKTPTYSDTDTDDDRETSEVNRTNNTTFDLPSSDKLRSSASKGRNARAAQLSVASKKNNILTNRRLSKRTEILLAGNSSKRIEEPLGRLRFQEAPIQPHEEIEKASDDRMGENQFFKSPGTTSTQSRWINFKKKYQALEKNHKFNFERVPHNEPWYVTFERQDKGCEHVYEYFANTSYCKLPYELGPLPPGKEDCCKLDDLIIPKDKLDSPGRKRGGKSAYPRMPSIAKVNDRTRSSTAAIIEATKVAEAHDETTNDSSKLKLTLPLKKRKLFMEDAPRKSPREHASTLAILSSLSKESSSAPSSISGANRINKRERLTSQLSIEDDDNSNSTMTSQQTSKTVATEKDNSSVYSNSISNNQIQTNYVNIVKLCKQIDDMLDGAGDSAETDLYKFDISDVEYSKSLESHEISIGSNIGDLSEILDVCSLEELTLKSVASKEKEVQRKITYTTKPKLVTSGFRFNKKRRNRTGWPVRRKTLQPKDKVEENELEKSGNCSTPFEDTLKNNLTPDIFAVSSDSLDTHVVEFMKKEKNKIENINHLENGSSAEDENVDEPVVEEEREDEHTQEEVKPVVKSPVRPTRPNVYNRGAGKYQFEKYPKVNLTPICMTNIKTRSSDLQKRKSITPKKYTDTPTETARSPVSSPQKFSPRKLRKPRGRWYRER